MHNLGLASLKKAFADQFEANDKGYLYRHRQRAAAVQVSAGEREAMLTALDRTLRLWAWAMPIASAVAIVLVMALEAQTAWTAPAYWPYVGTAALIAVFYLAIRRAWDAPLRQLRHRAPVAPSRSAEDFRRSILARTSYFTLIWPPAVFLLAYGNLMRGQNPMAGWNLAWTALVVGLVGLAAVQVVRKRRMQRGASTARGSRGS